MHLITVQGEKTGTFKFRDGSGQEFRSFVESLVLNSATIICSPYRIDLMYAGNEDHHDEILKAWCRIIGKDLNQEIKRNFIRTSGKLESLETYFTSLIYLARIPDWFNRYRYQLNLSIDQEPNHPIHKEIVECARYLATKVKHFERPFRTPDKSMMAYHLFKNTRSFASHSAKKYLLN